MKKFFSVILSLVFLMTSMGFTVSSHICGGKRVKTVVSMSVADVSCGMEKTRNNCASGEQMRSNCCQDEFLLMQLEENYTQQLTEVDFSNDFLVAFVVAYFDLIENTIAKKDLFHDLSPPPLIRDIPVFVQSFLI